MGAQSYPQGNRICGLQGQGSAEVDLGGLGVAAAALQCCQCAQRLHMVRVHLQSKELKHTQLLLRSIDMPAASSNSSRTSLVR